MEVQVKKLILHEYSAEDIRKNCVPNAMKTDTLEWNEEANRLHKFSNDIQNSDVVFDIEDINHHEEQYGYFFFNKMVSSVGVIGYRINKIVLDESLQEEFIRCVTENVLSLLINDNILLTNRIIINEDKNYPLSKSSLINTSKAVSDEIVIRFITEKDGFMNNPNTIKWLDDLTQRINGE